MESRDWLELYDRELRREVILPDMTREDTPLVTRYLRPAPGLSFILHSRLDEPGAARAIAAEQAYFAAKGLRLEWKVCAHDLPASLPARLAGAGFVADEGAAVMALDLAEAPARLREEPGLDVRRLTQPGDLEDVIAVMRGVWGGSFDWMRARLGAHLRIPGYLSLYAAYVDGQPACAAWTYFYPGSQFAGLWGGSTLPQFRGRGLYTALLACRAAEAARRGVRFLVMEASDMSHPIVARHGFCHQTDACGYSRED